jgi:NitT/TauT family transport system substrate-binding protein
MLYKPLKSFVSKYQVPIWAFVWFVAVSVTHLQVNGEHEKRTVVKMGYMSVITNLAAPLLDKASREKGDISYQAIKFSSFSEMGEALRGGSIDVAFMIAPLSIVLRQQGLDVRIICIGNRHESTLVVRKGQGIHHFRDLQQKTLAVPMRFSGHNILSLELRKLYSSSGQIKIVEMNPPDMPATLISGALDGYFVGGTFCIKLPC